MEFHPPLPTSCLLRFLNPITTSILCSWILRRIPSSWILKRIPSLGATPATARLRDGLLRADPFCVGCHKTQPQCLGRVQGLGTDCKEQKVSLPGVVLASGSLNSVPWPSHLSFSTVPGSPGFVTLLMALGK